MCGIVGLVQFDGQPIDRDVLRQMTAALAHRGPEGHGCRLVSSGAVQVGLGHTRLKVIDLSDQAAQPMSSDDGLIWLTFNGEIYNYRVLRAALEADGVRFRTSSDTEVLLRLYEAQGEQCLERLEGMFAFAVWDGHKGCLVLARDRVGKKPLFYSATPTRVAFASEMKALFCHPELAPEIDEAALPPFFLFGYVPMPDTFYRGVRSVPPGCAMRISRDGQLHLQAYWNLFPSPAGTRAPGRVPSEREAMGTIRELMRTAVQRRLVADVPLGAFLSGGIDSSVVVAMMSQLLKEPVRTFSIGFSGDPHFDETAYARLVAKRFGTRHTEFVVTPSAVELVERLVWHYDGPFADSSAIPTYLLARLTREHVTVALSGDGGDELFAGYLRFYATVLSERVPVGVRRAARKLLAGLPAWGGSRQPFRRLQKFAGSAALPFAERFSRWNAVFYEDLPALLPATRGAVAEASEHGRGPWSPPPLARLEPYLAECGDASLLTRLLYVNLKTYLLDDLLVKMDRCSMAHALETRSPFLDRELMEYVFSLPDGMKLRGGRTKVMLRRAFSDLLPKEILTRGKMGFGVPLQAWFRTDLRDYLQEMLLAPSAKLRAYVNQAYVRQLCEDDLSGRADHSHKLWTLLTFEVWLRQLKAWSQPQPPPWSAQPLVAHGALSDAGDRAARVAKFPL